MPKGYSVPYNEPGSIGEQLLGRGDDKRTTKTFIEDGSLAMFLGFVRSMPDAVLNTGRRLMAEETGKDFADVSTEDVLTTYPEAKELIEIHQQIVEHKGSQGGYLVDRYVQGRREEIDSKTDKKSSSGEPNLSVNKRWS
jgi:hypothetical protein